MNLFGNKIDSLLDTPRICNLIKYSNDAPKGGYIAEFGMYQGGSLEILARFNPGIDIIGIDSFEGLPKPSEFDFLNEGHFGGLNARNIIGYFGLAYPAVRIFKGFIPNVFEAFDGNTRFSFVHVDLDLYDSIFSSLDFLLPRMIDGGIILLDDYKVRDTPGCEKAIDHFFERHNPEVKFRGELKLHEGGPTNHQYLIVK